MARVKKKFLNLGILDRRAAAALEEILTKNPNGQKDLSIVATRGQLANVSSVTLASAATGDSYRCRHVITKDCADPRFVYKNTRVTNPVEVASSGLWIGGKVYPVTFNGAKSAILEVGAAIKSDPVGIELKEGDVVYSLTYVKVTVDGHQYPGGIGGFPTVGEGKVAGTDITRNTAVPTTTTGFMFSPIAILGTSPKTKSSILIAGDSISVGVGDRDPYYGALNNGDGLGFVVRALDNKFGYYNIGKGGTRALNYTSTELVAMDKITHAIVTYGVNDLAVGNQSFEQLKTSLLAIWNALSLRGIKVYQCTIVPCTDSTDDWATVGNQTPRNARVDTDRALINDYIRTCPTPLSGCFDTASAVESGLNSGKWKPGMVYLTDKLGIHPNAAGHEAMASKIDTTKFV